MGDISCLAESACTNLHMRNITIDSSVKSPQPVSCVHVASGTMQGVDPAVIPALCTSSNTTATQHGAGTGVLSRVRAEGGRFVDEAGRTMHFRGVNVVYKDPPYLPHAEEFHANLSFVEAP